ncbi:hypothetical protein [Nocardia sp. NPDC057030]|uniref:hypothetical protein n=1 Tax=unclassified Nocardia TaxID=2637762 RepID=UPI0036312910
MLEFGIDPAVVAAAMGLTRPNPARVRAVLDLPNPAAAADIVEALAYVATGRPRTVRSCARARIAEQLAFFPS